jgi:hypothetical protein
MSLFICEKCFCIENTATGRYWTKDSADLWDDDNLGQALCTQCEPLHFRSGESNDGGGRWHGRFPKRHPSFEEVRDADPDLYLNRDAVLELWKQRGRIMGSFENGRHDAEYWEIEDIGVHAHIKVRGGDDDMIALGVPAPLACVIVARHNKALDGLISSLPMSDEEAETFFYDATKRTGW